MARSKSKRLDTGAARDAATEPAEDIIWAWASCIYFIWKRTRFRLESGVTDYYQLSALTSFDLEELESKRAPVLDYTRTVPGLKPDHHLFAELATVAQVSSAEGIDRLQRGVLYELSHQWVVLAEPASVTADSKKRALAQLRALAKLSHDLTAIVSNLDEQALSALAYANSKSPRVFSDYRTVVAEFAKLSSEALMLLWKPKPRGRPTGGSFLIWHYSGPKPLAEFTLNLLLDVRAAGGQLTFDKNAGAGTLTQALALLRPYAPPGRFPNELPSSLARIKALDTKIAKAAKNIQS